MPKGPQGQKRPADVIGNAVRVMRIATGDAEEEYDTSGEARTSQQPSWAERAVRRGPSG
jgi:flagellar basal body L-ring protein FlgH